MPDDLQTKLGYAKDPPWTTKLAGNEEYAFQKWVKQFNIPWKDEPTADYDMRGFWKALTSGDQRAVRNMKTKHFPDVWKTPYHQTFSNESMYAKPEAPHWQGNQLINSKGQVIYSE